MPTTDMLEWRDFFAAIANAGAALVGLVFVGVSIHVSRHALDGRTRMLATIAALTLLHPLIAATAMLLPVSPRALGIGLLLLAGSGVAGIVGVDLVVLRSPREENAAVTAYRYVLPLTAEAVLLFACAALIAGWRIGLYAIATFILLMFIVGIQNAWDLLLRSTDEHPTATTCRIGTLARRWRLDSTGSREEPVRATSKRSGCSVDIHARQGDQHGSARDDAQNPSGILA
jgi:hypothetical protein